MSLILFVEYVGIASAALSGFLFAVNMRFHYKMPIFKEKI